MLGYRVCGPRKSLLTDVRAGNLDAVLNVMTQHDAFEDWPWPLVYRQAYETYGEAARFILTVRKDEDAWFRSIEQHGYGTDPLKSMKTAYGYYRPFGRKKEFVEIYREHNAAVRAYFADKPHVFTEFCLEKGDGWEKLCNLLGQVAPIGQPTPHSNKTIAGRKVMNRMLNKTIALIYSRLPKPQREV